MSSTPLDHGEVFDCVIIVTDDSAYDYAWIVRESKLVIDSRNATRGVAAEYAGKIVRC